MRFRPCIDLHQGKVKQIVGGTLTDNDTSVSTNFESEYNPAHYARIYRQDKLTGGHVIMLGPGNESAAREALAAYPGGLQVGGGINADNALEWLEAGASHIILTSYVFSDGELKIDRLKKLLSVIGRDTLVLDLSCRLRDGRYYIVTDRWQQFTSMEVNAGTLKQLAGYCAEFLIHAVDVEGKQAGIDTDLLKIMGDNCPIPATYAGGIRSLEDIRTVHETGNARIDFTVGSALDIFGGSLKYNEVVEFTSDLK
ncbi:phosphoribosylformimino-5-aminoimidazole carboxamide ribotide isomerase [Lentisphaerota bacterium ZTH]|nr:phosphoribosylformimino-5-aminoimidazole carboxamide ribotide isomerase [Lentisphaerota bacterium]WET07066.1 phosphoribosylformimino-5-aminoimidazole carboxamide ribotide isomerase [Lentisphaerota bacterium ZTH]